jgi:hypothetical protein
MDIKSENCAPLAINFVYSRFKKNLQPQIIKANKKCRSLQREKPIALSFFKKKGSDVCHYYQSPDTLKKM